MDAGLIFLKLLAVAALVGVPAAFVGVAAGLQTTGLLVDDEEGFHATDCLTRGGCGGSARSGAASSRGRA